MRWARNTPSIEGDGIELAADSDLSREKGKESFSPARQSWSDRFSTCISVESPSSNCGNCEWNRPPVSGIVNLGLCRIQRWLRFEDCIGNITLGARVESVGLEA